MSSSLSSNTPFNVLLKQAADLKTDQLSQQRRWYDKQYQWLQHSLFYSQLCKTRGNEFVKSVRLYEAMEEYEKALSVFHWIETKDGSNSWKTEGIDDSLLIEKRMSEQLLRTNTDDKDNLLSLQISLILNLSHCHLQLKEWNNCIAACSYVINNLDPNNIKALFRRAKAYSTPLSSGRIEFQFALEDLSKAIKLNSTDLTIRSEYTRIFNEVQNQKKKDKKSLGFLNNKELNTSDEYIYKNQSKANNKETPKLSYVEALKIVNNLKIQLSDAIEVEDIKQSKKISEDINDIELLINEYESSMKTKNNKIDFLNPSEQMIIEAREKGIDLNDKKIRRLLHNIENNKNELSDQNNSSENDYIDEAITKLHEEEADEISNHIINGLDHEQLKSLLFSRNMNFNINNLELEELKEELLGLLKKDIIEYYNTNDSNNNDTNDDNNNKDLFAFLSARYDLKGDESSMSNPIVYYYNSFRKYLREINVPFNLFVGAVAALLYLIVVYLFFNHNSTVDSYYK